MRLGPFLLLLSVLSTVVPGILPAATSSEEARIQQDLARKKKDLAEIERRLQAQRREQALVHALEKNVLLRLERMDRDLERLGRESRVNTRDLRETRTRIAGLTGETAEASVRLAQMRGDLRRRLTALYRAGRTGNLLSFWLGAKSPGETSRELKFEMLLAQSNEKLLHRTVQEKERLQRDKRSLSFQETRREHILRDLRGQEERALDRRGERSRLLTSLRKEQALRVRTIQDLASSRSELHSTVTGLLKKAEEVRLAAKGTQAGKGLGALKGRLPWPVEGRVIEPFGRYKSREFNTTFENSGVQIRAPLGAPVKSIASAKVRYADWFKGFGKLVILDHGGGYYSLYAQAAELYVSEGDSVALGQVIASVGDTGSLVGNALYFEMRKNGLPVNPVAWLRK